MNPKDELLNPQTSSVVQAPNPYPWYPPMYGQEQEEEVNLLDYWKVLKKYRLKIIFITFLFTLLGILSCFLISKKYQAEATIMPLTQSSGGGGLSALMSQASSIPGLGGALSGLGGAGAQKSMQLVNFLKSRTLTEKIINQLDLMPILFKKRWDPQQNAFKPDRWGQVPTMEDTVSVMRKKIVKVSDDKKTGLIKLQVEMKDPVLSAAVANRMLIDLQDFLEKNDITVAKRNRIFIEGQLRQNKIELLEAGKKLNQFYNSNRISSIQPQLDVEIGKMMDTPRSLEDVRTTMTQLEQQKEDLDKKIQNEEKVGIVHNVPSQVYLQYMTLQRELLGRVNALLTQQYEMAKIEEAKEDLTFQVIDKAVVPIKPVSPVPILNVSISLMAGLFFSIFYVFFLEYIEKMKQADLAKK